MNSDYDPYSAKEIDVTRDMEKSILINKYRKALEEIRDTEYCCMSCAGEQAIKIAAKALEEDDAEK